MLKRSQNRGPEAEEARRVYREQRAYDRARNDREYRQGTPRGDPPPFQNPVTYREGPHTTNVIRSDQNVEVRQVGYLYNQGQQARHTVGWADTAPPTETMPLAGRPPLPPPALPPPARQGGNRGASTRTMQQNPKSYFSRTKHTT